MKILSAAISASNLEQMELAIADAMLTGSGWCRVWHDGDRVVTSRLSRQEYEAAKDGHQRRSPIQPQVR